MKSPGRKRGIIRRTRDGRNLCSAHRTSGAPSWYHAGCEACEDARAKGIIRPDASSVSLGRRRRGEHRVAFVDHEWARQQTAARAKEMAAMVLSRKVCP